MARNGRFSYSGGSFDVYVTKFSYNWSLKQKGSSQARKRQTIYPFRMVQSDLTVELQFRDLDEYRRFGEFARGYHLAVTSSAGQVGVDVPAMYFTSNVIPHQTLRGEGRADDGGIRYAVAMPTVPLAFSNDSVAPTMRLTLNILMDESGDSALSSVSSSYVSGSLSGMLEQVKVSPYDVKSLGSLAYSVSSTASRVATSVANVVGRS